LGNVGSLDRYAIHQHGNSVAAGDDDHLSEFQSLHHPTRRSSDATVQLELVALSIHGDRRHSAFRRIDHDPSDTEICRRDLALAVALES